MIHGFGDREVLLIVAGPEGHVSPSWYAPGAVRAPTWNFSVAHCYGTPQILEASENVEVLTRLVAHFERHVDEPTWPVGVSSRTNASNESVPATLIRGSDSIGTEADALKPAAVTANSNPQAPTVRATAASVSP